MRPVLNALPFRRAMIELYRVKGLDACSRRMVKWLVRDQFIVGRLRGQFGRSQSVEEQKRNKGLEAPTGRPRLFQSSWVCFVFTKHHLAHRQMSASRRNLERLLAPGEVRAVVRSARPDANKIQSSIRHAIRGAHTLWVLDRSSVSAIRIAKRMLDPGEHWHDSSNGGWRQLTERRTPDLWASIYAADYLDSLLAECPEWLDADSARVGLAATLTFLRSEWSENNNRWAYDESLPEENVPQVLACLGALLQREAPDLLEEVDQWTRPWFTPAGDLSIHYVEKCKVVPLAAGAVRLGQYFFSTQRDARQWHRLLMQGLEGFESLRSAADVAMILNLAIAAGADPLRSS